MSDELTATANDLVRVVAERKIEEAMRDGLFDNLPGRGKSLDLSGNPFEERGMSTANRPLMNSQVNLACAVLDEIERLRAEADNVVERWEPHSVLLPVSNRTAGVQDVFGIESPTIPASPPETIVPTNHVGARILSKQLAPRLDFK